MIEVLSIRIGKVKSEILFYSYTRKLINDQQFKRFYEWERVKEWIVLDLVVKKFLSGQQFWNLYAELFNLLIIVLDIFKDFNSIMSIKHYLQNHLEHYS